MNKLKQQGFYYGALWYVFLIPFPQKIINIAIGTWAILSIVGFSSTSFVRNKYLLLLPAFYGSYCIGFITSEQTSFQFLEHKLSLLIFPLIFFLREYTEEMRNRMLKMLIWGLGASVVICLFIAFYHSFKFSDGVFQFQPNVLEGRSFMESILYGGNHFFGRHLSIFHQTVYYAMYLCIGVAVLLLKPGLFPRKSKWFFLILFLIMVFLVSNKASFIALALVFLCKLWSWQVNRLKKLMGVSAFVLAMGLFALLNPRIKESAIHIVNGEIALNKDARYGFGTRLLSWDAAVSLIQEKPILGYGYANSQDELNSYYREKEYTFPFKEAYNAHNLWLQSWLENGALAILLLLGIFLALLSISYRSSLFVSFILVLLVNSMFEGMFNRFSGISYFSFLVCFIFSSCGGGHVKS